MQNPLSADYLLSKLADEVRAQGYAADHPAADRLSAVREIAAESWWLGRRVFRSLIACRVDALKREADIDETLMELTRGLPPPHWFRRAWRQTGLNFAEAGRERWPSGSVPVEYGALRRRLADIARAAGWTVKGAQP